MTIGSPSAFFSPSVESVTALRLRGGAGVTRGAGAHDSSSATASSTVMISLSVFTCTTTGS